jgi:hypothetical protein
MPVKQFRLACQVSAQREAGFPPSSAHLQLKTRIPERPRYESVIYRVSRGDAMLRIAESYKVKDRVDVVCQPQLEDNPHNLKPGMELLIPPVDGLYYEWKEGDTFERLPINSMRTRMRSSISPAMRST